MQRPPARRDRPESAAGGVHPRRSSAADGVRRTGPNRRAAQSGPRPSAADARAIGLALHDAGAGVIVRTSAGEHGTVFVLGRDQGDAAVPTIVLAGEHYNMIVRMLARGMPVKLRVNVQAHFVTDDPNSYNVVADDSRQRRSVKDEVVLLGAHLDSWHTATGASDNADGAAALLEAMRILQAVGAQPAAHDSRRVLGRRGSRDSSDRRPTSTGISPATRTRPHAIELFVYLNLDPGTGPIYGWYLEDTPSVKPLFDAWLAPLRDLGHAAEHPARIGNTDHLSFRAVGIPGFNAIQEYATYDVRTHHTNVDTYERVREQDLKQNAVVLAWFALQAANTSERIPRPADTRGQ